MAWPVTAILRTSPGRPTPSPLPDEADPSDMGDPGERAASIALAARHVRKYAFDPAQPRNEDGEWEDKEGAWSQPSGIFDRKVAESKVGQLFVQGLDKATLGGMNESHGDAFNVAFRQTIRAMGDVPLSRLARNLSRVRIFGDRDSLTAEAARLEPVIYERLKANPKFRTGGIWRHNPGHTKGELLLNRGNETDPKYRELIRENYAHEIGHGVDAVIGSQGNVVRASDSPIWRDAFDRDQAALYNRIVQSNPVSEPLTRSEAFSHFARFLWTSPTWAVQAFPAMTKAWARMNWFKIPSDRHSIGT